MENKLTLEDVVRKHLEISSKTVNYSEESKKRLETILAKKIQTTMIGALSAIEDTFGFLWGKDKRELSEVESKMAELYKTLRKRILDNGNNQIQAVRNELEQYSINWNRYSMVLEVKKKDGQDEEQNRSDEQ